jgi:hypothetical protein
MRCVHLRGQTDILKRLLIHTSGFNLGLLVHQLIGVGTPRGLQGTSRSSPRRGYWREPSRDMSRAINRPCTNLCALD